MRDAVYTVVTAIDPGLAAVTNRLTTRRTRGIVQACRN